MKKNNIRKFHTVLIAILCLLAAGSAVVFTGLRQKPVYGQTYYAALPGLYARLSGTEGKKIVIIGNSCVPFGVDQALLTELLNEAGYDYTVCNFGLYGSIGTRAMLSLAEEKIGEGDIVLFMPEADKQSQSAYYSGDELWRAAEGHEEIVFALDKEMVFGTLADYPGFVAERARQRQEAAGAGVYALSSFDDNMNFVNCSRERNETDGGADLNNPVDLDVLMRDETFFDIVSSFYETVKEQNAEMYFVYAPVNALSLTGDREEYEKRIAEGFDFPAMGELQASVMDPEWFFDSNHHLNETGMTVFTVTLFDSLKTRFGDASVTEVTLPAKPGETEDEEPVEGDNADEGCFIYEETGNGYKISGLTGEGKLKKQLTIPVSHNGKRIAGIDKAAFKDAEELRLVIVQKNIKSLPDYVFDGSHELAEIRLLHDGPEEISVGYHLLAGTNARITVKNEAESAFKNNYFWGNYAEVIRSYE